MEEKTYPQGFKWEKRKCVDCGKEFIAKQNKSVRCLDCRMIYKKDWQREYQRDYNAGLVKPKEEEKHDPNVCEKSESCYYGDFAGRIPICNFLKITKSRRPCKAGDCVMYKRKE